MRHVYVLFVASIGALVFLSQHCEAIFRPIIRLRPKIVLGKGGYGDSEDDSLKIYRAIAKTVISGYLFGALRRPFIHPYGSSYGGWSGLSPVSVTFAVGGKKPYQQDPDSSDNSDKSPKVEKIKIIEKETKEKPVKHIVISHKILGPPASSMSVTGGHLMPSMLEESAMAAIEAESSSSPWGESSSLYGMPEALDTTKRVKVIKIKETSSSSNDEEEYSTEDDDGDDDSSGDYKVIKRKVYTYKDKSIDEPKTSKYGYNPNYEGEQAMAESTQAHVIRIDNSTIVEYSVTPQPLRIDQTTVKTATNSFSLITTPSTINQTKSLGGLNESVNQTTTLTPDPLTTIKLDTVANNKTNKSAPLGKETDLFDKKILSKINRSIQLIKKSEISAEDPLLDDYLKQKELQESQTFASRQSIKTTTEPVTGKKKKSRKNRNRGRNSNKSKSSSRSKNNYNQDSNFDLGRDLEINPKINSVKAFGDGWVARRRSKSKSRSRKRSSKGKGKKNSSKYRIITIPSLNSAQNLPFDQIVALPSSSLTSLSASGPTIFPASMKRSFLETPYSSFDPILMPTLPILNRRSFRS